MSDEQKKNLPDLHNSGNESQQAEGLSRREEIVHEDGRRATIESRAQQYWSGTLPRPEDFAKYAEVVPDAPERILAMAEKEQQHRIDLERQIVPANNEAGRRGQWLGAIISIAALTLAVLADYLGAPWQVPIALVGVPVLSVARSLVMVFRNNEE